MNRPSFIDQDVLILGAGAAGLMCAIQAGQRGRSVTVLEHNDGIGKKIRISGGGRCNFTNLLTTSAHFLCSNAHFATSALKRFSPEDFCRMVSRHGIAFHEKKLGQLFCDKSAQDIIFLLKKECDRHGVKILTGQKIFGIAREDQFKVSCDYATLRARSLVVATGGLSIPTLGATDLGYRIAKQFHINVRPCRPGLVPLTLGEKDLSVFKTLAGVSTDTLVSFDKVSFRENTLFTHRGLSGPAILQISSYWEPGRPIVINFFPDNDMPVLLHDHRTKKTTLKNFLRNRLPARLIDVLCGHFIESKPLNAYSANYLKKTGETLNCLEIIPAGTEGYAKAEVTVGGIDTDELSSKTMESKKVPGLYFIGEVVDVTGHLGGFNFQWAWASGHAAGQNAG